jgi:hypothetical protein
MADYRARLFMAGRFIRHQQILGTRPEGRSAHAEQLGVPKPDARGHDARSPVEGSRILPRSGRSRLAPAAGAR